jgi:hypothetical protein
MLPNSVPKRVPSEALPPCRFGCRDGNRSDHRSPDDPPLRSVRGLGERRPAAPPPHSQGAGAPRPSRPTFCRRRWAAPPRRPVLASRYALAGQPGAPRPPQPPHGAGRPPPHAGTGGGTALGQPGRAARLLGAAEALRETLGFAVPPVDRCAHEQVVATARAGLGEERFATAWAEGRAMSLHEAMALALKSEVPPESSVDAKHSTASCIAPATTGREYPGGR